jgi:hypothetical protein
MIDTLDVKNRKEKKRNSLKDVRLIRHYVETIVKI